MTFREALKWKWLIITRIENKCFGTSYNSADHNTFCIYFSIKLQSNQSHLNALIGGLHPHWREERGVGYNGTITGGGVGPIARELISGNLRYCLIHHDILFYISIICYIRRQSPPYEIIYIVIVCTISSSVI